MAYAAFLADVRTRGGYDSDEAERITRAVVAALGQRLPPEQAEHLADQLPQPMSDLLTGAPARITDWSVSQFCDHVAEELAIGSQEARADARIVLATLASRISGGELNKILTDLPSGYADLFGHPELTG